ncbi:hypothetical protein RIF29_40485 [Crotalaria pallida]|uniref:Uncharacterized protein n=1 Tax=Crotalaria pallida TaxID=3830 RepID=A0AAN9E5M3_CROPI
MEHVAAAEALGAIGSDGNGSIPILKNNLDLDPAQEKFECDELVNTTSVQSLGYALLEVKTKYTALLAAALKRRRFPLGVCLSLSHSGDCDVDKKLPQHFQSTHLGAGSFRYCTIVMVTERATSRGKVKKLKRKRREDFDLISLRSSVLRRAEFSYRTKRGNDFILPPVCMQEDEFLTEWLDASLLFSIQYIDQYTNILLISRLISRLIYRDMQISR